METKKKILITGSAGFIGYFSARLFLEKGFHVTGLDNLNNYYDKNLKLLRLKFLEEFIQEKNLDKCYCFKKVDLKNFNSLNQIFEKGQFDYVLHLAAQAGVRYSLENPSSYIDSNLIGFANIIELTKKFDIKHLVYASSSSVYGLSSSIPFEESQNTDFPISLYAATKKSNENIAFSYSHLFKIPITGLRFFTVYGPFGRPDMAYFKFANLIYEDKPIELYSADNMYRDFTYVDDIVDSIIRIVENIPSESSFNETNATAPFRILNIGNNKPESLINFVSILEKLMNKKAKIINLPMQKGDVEITYADVSNLQKIIDYRPNTSIEVGLSKFIDWFFEWKK